MSFANCHSDYSNTPRYAPPRYANPADMYAIMNCVNFVTQSFQNMPV